VAGLGQLGKLTNASSSALRSKRNKPRLAEVTGTRTDGGSGQRVGRNGRTKVNLLLLRQGFVAGLFTVVTLLN
jgi:hypothetical protein